MNIEHSGIQESAFCDKYIVHNLDRIMTDFYYVKDINGYCVQCNTAMLALLGKVSKEEIIGRKDQEIFADLIEQKDIELLLTEDQNVIQAGQKSNLTVTLKLSSQQTKIVLLTKQAYSTPQNQIEGVITYATDITKLTQLKTDAENYKADDSTQQVIAGETVKFSGKQPEEEKLNMMTSLATTIAHEMRTPLASINMRAEFAQKFIPELVDFYLCHRQLDSKNKLKLKDKSLTLLAELPAAIRRETATANAFINMLLMNLKPVEGTEQAISMANCVTESIDSYPFQPKERERVFWQGNNDFIVKTSEVLLVHVIFNLMKNALYYTHDSGAIRIWLDNQDDAYNLLYFEDTGRGVPAEILPHIFDQFFSKTRHGTGLGLYFCKMVMKLADGQIQCESEEGQYTRFILKFPKQVG